MGQLNAITSFITQLLTQHVGQFAFLGQGMFLSFATIVIVWFGVKSALSAGDRGGGFQFGHFASLVMMIAFGYAMTQYYATPTGNIAYIIDLIIMALWEAVAVIITAYGFVAQAICVLVGPIFIPFFIVPKLEWLFWGWLKCFMQYAFYQVIAAATMFIMGNLVIFVLTQPPFFPIPDPVTLLTLLIVVFLGGVYALLKVPALTSHIFSGMSGLSSGTSIVGYFLP